MGQTFMGGSKVAGNTSLLTKQQGSWLNDLLSGTQGQAGQVAQQFLGNTQPGQFQDLFQQAYVDPAMMAFERNVLPSIQQRYADVGAGSSSALNQALGQAATDVSTMIGSQAGQFYGQQQSNALNLLNVLAGLSGQRTFEPNVKTNTGILPGLIEGGLKLGGAYLGGPLAALQYGGKGR